MNYKTKIIAAILMTALCADVLAESAKTHVDIAIDPTFKDKNIVFTVQTSYSTDETVGFYQAGQPLAIHADVNPIVDEHGNPIPMVITAYVSDSTARQTETYQSKDTYQFSEGSMIGLSFPIMFNQD